MHRICGRVRCMARERDGGSPSAAYSILPRDAKFAGTLFSEGDALQIDGEFEGQIITDDLVVVGADAEVRAQVSAGSVIIQGSVEGEIDAKGSVKITGSGRIKGSVMTP